MVSATEMSRETTPLFGIQTVQSDPWPELARRWRWFESLGFDSLWLPDHLVNRSRPTSRSTRPGRLWPGWRW